ncbi:MAG: LysR family transcriptional regulator [Alphaproteobacteria bacterium]|nr:LysR family transcriptional regulator [Alphaproteobacteria bacterium]
MAYDLNLLRVFDAVMEERNVTAAAARLGISQSAASAALSRLRAIFDDELFMRARYGVIPTDTALAVAPVVAETLGRLDRLVQDAPGFDPATGERRFTIAASAYFECVLIPRVMTRASRDAPKVSVVVQPLTPDLEATDLATGKIDLALGRFADPPEHLVVRQFMEDGFLCLVRRGDAPRGRRLTRNRFEAMKHIVVSPPGRWRTGLFRQLKAAGLSRRVLLTVSHFLAAPLAVAETGGCATLPRKIAEMFADDARFRLLEPPVDLGRFPMHMAWHPRHRRDAGRAWLRQLIQDVSKGL